MRKLIVLVTLGMMSMIAFGQQKLEWGIKAGWNISYPVDATRASYGFNAGVFGQLNLNRIWYLDAGLRFNYKPWCVKHSYDSDNMWNGVPMPDKATGNPFALELPVHAGIRFDLAPSAKMFVSLGPYIGTGLFGKGKVTSIMTDSGVKETESLNMYGDSQYSMRRFEVGADASIGVEIKDHYRISVDYLFQFNNAAEGTVTPVSHAQVFSLNLGYKF